MYPLAQAQMPVSVLHSPLPEQPRRQPCLTQSGARKRPSHWQVAFTQAPFPAQAFPFGPAGQVASAAPARQRKRKEADVAKSRDGQARARAARPRRSQRAGQGFAVSSACELIPSPPTRRPARARPDAGGPFLSRVHLSGGPEPADPVAATQVSRVARRRDEAVPVTCFWLGAPSSSPHGRSACAWTCPPLHVRTGAQTTPGVAQGALQHAVTADCGGKAAVRSLWRAHPAQRPPEP